MPRDASAAAPHDTPIAAVMLPMLLIYFIVTIERDADFIYRAILRLFTREYRCLRLFIDAVLRRRRSCV